MGPDPLRRGAGLRPRLGTRLPDDLVRLLRHDGARGAGHQAHQDWHRRRDSRHSYRAGYRAFDRDDQPDRAGARLSRDRDGAYRDARDWAAAEATQTPPRISARGP